MISQTEENRRSYKNILQVHLSPSYLVTPTKKHFSILCSFVYSCPSGTWIQHSLSSSINVVRCRLASDPIDRAQMHHTPHLRGIRILTPVLGCLCACYSLFVCSLAWLVGPGRGRGSWLVASHFLLVNVGTPRVWTPRPFTSLPVGELPPPPSTPSLDFSPSAKSTGREEKELVCRKY